MVGDAGRGGRALRRPGHRRRRHQGPPPGHRRAGRARTRLRGPGEPGNVHHPNIVFVLTDDLSMNLLPYMPQVQALQRDGHDVPQLLRLGLAVLPVALVDLHRRVPARHRGVHQRRRRRRAPRRSTPTATRTHVQRRAPERRLPHGDDGQVPQRIPAGPQAHRRSPARTSRPAGTSGTWPAAATTSSTTTSTRTGRIRYYGTRPRDYLTDVLARRGVELHRPSARARASRSSSSWRRSRRTRRTRRRRATPATFPGLQRAAHARFDRLPDRPAALAGRPPAADPRQIERIDSVFRRRVQAVQAVDGLIARMRGGAVRARHRRQHLHRVQLRQRLPHGRVPADARQADRVRHRHPCPARRRRARCAGRTRTSDAMAENVDLAKTFAQIGGTRRTPCDGHSLLRCCTAAPGDWRNAVLVEHHGPEPDADDPDRQDRASGNPPLRGDAHRRASSTSSTTTASASTTTSQSDPYELHNLAATLGTDGPGDPACRSPASSKQCHGSTTCWAATHLPPFFAAGHFVPGHREHRRHQRHHS